MEAVQLLGKWTRLTQGHVLIGGTGCSCGLAAANVRVQDFEQQILDYLGGKYATAAKVDSIAALLRVMAAQPVGGDGQALALLADLDRTLESFDELHRAR